MALRSLLYGGAGRRFGSEPTAQTVGSCGRAT